MYRFHVMSNHWRDIGYNFLIDKCGTVYEGRAGGVAKPVMGAHTLGFNSDSTGIAVLGAFTDTEPPRPAIDAIARLTAWKLGLYGVDPRTMTKLLSAAWKPLPQGRQGPAARHLRPPGRLHHRLPRPPPLQQARRHPPRRGRPSGPLTCSVGPGGSTRVCGRPARCMLQGPLNRSCR